MEVWIVQIATVHLYRKTVIVEAHSVIGVRLVVASFWNLTRTVRSPDSVKRLCLKMYLNGMGLRAIERVTQIHHTTVMHWIREAASTLPNAPQVEEIPEITELDELQTFVGSKQNKYWLWSAVNHWQPGILAWVIGDRSAETFELLWHQVHRWESFWYVTDGYKVYPRFIESSDHLVSKTYMTRVENENTRLRHYLARLHRKTFCYSKSALDAWTFSSSASTLLKIQNHSSSRLNH